MDKSTILTEIISYYNFKTKAQFARVLGITPQALGNWIRRNKFKPEKVYTKCEELNPQWVISGKGPMLKAEYAIQEDRIRIAQDSQPASYAKKKVQNILLFEQGPSSTLKEMLNNSSTKAVVSGFIRVPGLPKCDGATYVSNDSMLPLLKKGDIVFFKETATDNLKEGKIYLVEFTSENKISLIMGVFEKSLSGSGFIKLIPENPGFKPQDIALDKINASALVHASIRPH